MTKIPVGISSCLLGEKVRYDGTDKYAAELVEKLGALLEFVSFCPEVDIGLGVPRETIQLVEDAGQVHCIGSQTTALDVTDRLAHCADPKQWDGRIFGYIFKARSPSCGLHSVPIYKRGQQDVLVANGLGVFARNLRENFPGLPVEEEGHLADPAIMNNFIQQIFAYQKLITGTHT